MKAGSIGYGPSHTPTLTEAFQVPHQDNCIGCSKTRDSVFEGASTLISLIKKHSVVKRKIPRGHFCVSLQRCLLYVDGRTVEVLLIYAPLKPRYHIQHASFPEIQLCGHANLITSLLAHLV